MVKLGLTGTVGAGKTTFLTKLSQLGWNVLSADEIVHHLWKTPELLQQACDRWGSDLAVDGKLNRPLLAQRVFPSKAETEVLNAMIHPYVRQQIHQWLPKTGLVCVEIPLLFESGRPHWVEGVVFLTAPMSLRASRNSTRGLDLEELRRRESHFLAEEEREEQSDWSYCNDGSVEDLESFAQLVHGQCGDMEQLRLVTSALVGEQGFAQGVTCPSPVGWLALVQSKKQIQDMGGRLTEDFTLSVRDRVEAVTDLGGWKC